MKKFICIVLVVVTTMVLFAGCGNRQIIDVTYSYDRAIIRLPNGEVVDGEVSSWRDYDGESIQIVIDGITYYTQASNVVLIREKEDIYG